MAAGFFISTRHSETHFELKLQNFAVKSNSEKRFNLRPALPECATNKQNKIGGSGKNLSFVELLKIALFPIRVGIAGKA